MKRDINVIGIDIAKRVFHVIGMAWTRGAQSSYASASIEVMGAAQLTPTW